MEMREEIFSSVGTQELDTRGYHVSDLEDIEFHWEDLDFKIDAFFRPCLGTRFSLSTFNTFEMGSVSENPVLMDGEEEKENSPPPGSATVSE